MTAAETDAPTRGRPRDAARDLRITQAALDVLADS